MIAQIWSQTSGVNGLRCASHLRTHSPKPARVVVFGSFLGGYHVLSELLFGDLAHRVTVVGVATDDPTQPFTNGKVRLWKYPHTPDDEMLVRRFAAAQKLPAFTGRVKSPEFCELMSNEWRPDLCLMATFGQKIPNHIIHLPRLGFFNFHHSGPTWPSYPGPDPIAAMVRDGRKDLVLTMHKVSDVIDDGEFVARSHPVPIPDGVNAIEMHRLTWPAMHPFIRTVVNDILHPGVAQAHETDLWTMHEEPAPYFTGEGTRSSVRARRSADDCMAGLRASRILRVVASVPFLTLLAPPRFSPLRIARGGVRQNVLVWKTVRPNRYIRRRLPRRLLSLSPFLNCRPMNVRMTGMAARQWTSSELRLLGKCPDAELVRKSGRTVQAIVTKRSQLGIPRFIGKGDSRPWLPKEEALLGTDMDNEVARRLGRTTVATTKRRQFLKIPHFSDRPWTAEEDELLGSTTDRQIAQEIGRSTRQVRERRRKLGILPFIYTPRDWTAEEERMLGEDSDYTAAKRLGRTLTSVTAKRDSLGIAPFRVQYRQWTDEEISQLGKKPDAELAQSLGRSLDAVRLQRRLRKIKGVDDLLAPRRWTQAEEKLLGKMTDEEVARLTGRKVPAVRNRRQRRGLPPTHFLRRPWTAAEEELLGSDTDEEIGRRLQRDKSTVGERRRQLGIPPKVPDWTPQEIELLGNIPDRQLAQQLGRTLFSVQNRRLKLGIPPAENPKYRSWTEQELSLLGTMPDADLAKQIDRPYAAVRDKRNQLKIAYLHPRYVWWKPKELELLTRFPDEDVAKLTGRPITAVQQKRWKVSAA